MRHVGNCRYLPFLFGFVIISCFCVQMLVLGPHAFASIHDQLDGEVTTYILRAKHIGEGTIPEFMGGVPTSTLVPASYGTFGFYLFFKPATAFNINYIFVQVISFIGMFLLLTKLDVNSWIVSSVSLLYSMLPFYSVYGLSVMGQPLFWYALMELWEKRNWKPYALTCLFTLFSSPVLVGFADCALILVLLIISWGYGRNRDDVRNSKAISYLLLLLLMIFIYFILYRDLISELFGSSYVSHRIEMVLSAITDWKQTIKDMWYEGHYHAISNHKELISWIIPVQFGSLIIFPLLEKGGRKKVIALVVAVFSAYFISVFYAVYHGRFGVHFRNHFGMLKNFQFDRIYWFNPGIWYTALGLAADLVLAFSKSITKTCRILSDQKTILHKRIYMVSRISAVAIVLVLLFSSGKRMWDESTFKKNVTGTVTTSFSSFYSPELFGDIKDYIKQSMGLEQSEYKVASVALYPSVPLYNGFYCVDGYSNNYPLEYKHRFREVIARELEKNDEIRTYFDDWGNRCYLFTSELGKKYYFTKAYDGKLQNFEINNNALRSLGCDFVLSGVEIEKSNGLVPIRSFENDNSPYRIWLYGLDKKE